MKLKIMIIIVLLSVIQLSAQDQVTIYNDNFSLVRTSLTLKLEKGLQDYFIDDIPSTIEANSVIINSKNKIDIFSQNYEYDLANTSKIMQKYIGKDIEIKTTVDEVFKGKLQFTDGVTIGIIDHISKKLILIKNKEIQNINLAEIPKNFFLKPTLHWKLNSPDSGSFPVNFSYMCSGMKWDVTYNSVWDNENNQLEINSWVTINNVTGKRFKNVKLKLIAGDVKKVSTSQINRYRREKLMAVEAQSAPEFSEKSFHDFHLYTLSDKVSINNKQTKQLRLFPISKVSATEKYEYQTNSKKVKSIIEFINSQKAGLGIPLPKGIVKIYKKDKDDNQLEFIGEDNLNHTPTNEKITLNTGYAFDLVGETKELDVRKLGQRIKETDMSVTLKNRSNKSKNITVLHNLYGDWDVYKENISYKKKNANQIEFDKKLKPGTEFEITWTEKIEY